MVSAVSEFFQSIFTDSLTKFLQPTYITAAFLLGLLNFIFIYPDMIAHNIVYIIYLSKIDPVIQAILVAAFVLVLSYILLSLNSYFQSFLTGGLWYRSLIGWMLIQLKRAQKEHLDNQVNQIKNPKKADIKQTLQLEQGTRFPEENDLISPTSLGNVMNATASYLKSRYGIDLTALWSHMEIVLTSAANTAGSSSDGSSSKDSGSNGSSSDSSQASTSADSGSKKSSSQSSTSDGSGSKKSSSQASTSDGGSTDSAGTALKTRIDNEKSTLDFLVTLTIILGLFAIEQVLVQFCWLHDSYSVLWEPFVFLFLAYVAYQAAVVKARTWGDAVEMAFDMYRSPLQSHLGIRPFTSAEDEREVWQKISQWLLNRTPCDEVFLGIPPYTVPPSTLTIKPSANLIVKQLSLERQKTDPGNKQTTLNGNFISSSSEQSTTCVLKITHAGNASKEQMFFFTSDPLISRIHQPPSYTVTASDGQKHEFECHIIPMYSESGIDQLLWTITSLPDNAVAYLNNTLPGPGHVFEISSKQEHLEVQKSSGSTNGYALSITNKGTHSINNPTFKVFDSQGPIPIPHKWQQGTVTKPDDPQFSKLVSANSLLEEHLEEHCFEWKIEVLELHPGKTISLRYS